MPKRPVNFGGNATKLPSLIDLRDLLTSGRLILPAGWTRMRQEVLNYKVKDEKLKQDNVMSLVGASIIAKSMTLGRRSEGFPVQARTTRKPTLRWG